MIMADTAPGVDHRWALKHIKIGFLEQVDAVFHIVASPFGGFLLGIPWIGPGFGPEEIGPCCRTKHIGFVSTVANDIPAHGQADHSHQVGHVKFTDHSVLFQRRARNCNSAASSTIAGLCFSSDKYLFNHLLNGMLRPDWL